MDVADATGVARIEMLLHYSLVSTIAVDRYVGFGPPLGAPLRYESCSCIRDILVQSEVASVVERTIAGAGHGQLLTRVACVPACY